MKLKLFIFVLLFTVNAYSQTIGPKIPWAQVQADWTFPIYFEDASGARDTFYCFMDSTYIDDPVPYGLVPLFNFDTCTSFVVFNSDWAFNHDVYKCAQGSIGINMKNAVFPVLISWDTSFFSTNQILGADLKFNRLCNVDFTCFDQLQSGYDLSSNSQLVISDSINGFPIDVFFMFEIPSSIKKLDNSLSDVFHLKDKVINFIESFDVEIFNISGQLISRYKDVEIVDLTFLNESIYILKIKNKKNHEYFKKIKL
jgi:hypothetical protein